MAGWYPPKDPWEYPLGSSPLSGGAGWKGSTCPCSAGGGRSTSVEPLVVKAAPFPPSLVLLVGKPLPLVRLVITCPGPGPPPRLIAPALLVIFFLFQEQGRQWLEQYKHPTSIQQSIQQAKRKTTESPTCLVHVSVCSGKGKPNLRFYEADAWQPMNNPLSKIAIQCSQQKKGEGKVCGGRQ